MLKRVATVCLVWAAAGSGVEARELHVNHERGSDEHSGAREISRDNDGPFKTIKRALDACGPGDTIHLAKTDTPYHEMIEIADGKSGAPGKPIVIDGHGATLSGLTMINPAEWIHVGDGLYRNDRLRAEIYPRTPPVNEPMLWRFFFRFDGRMSRMGKSGKSLHPPMPKPQSLKPGEWTYDESEMAFFLKIDPARQLSDVRIEYPDLINGVKTSDGACEHLVIRNLTARHFHNDGFNINGATTHTRFENVQAIENGDDGMSAHTASDIDVDGFISRGNSTGYCHVQGASSRMRNVELRANHAFEVLLTGWGTHELKQCSIQPAGGGVRVIRVTSEGAEANKRCGFTLEDVTIDGDQLAPADHRDPERQPIIEVLGNSDFAALKSDFRSISLVTRWPAGGTASVKLLNCRFTGATKPKIELLPATQWQADNNQYDLSSLSVGGVVYTAPQWPSYRQATGRDAHSIWKGADQE